MKKTVGGSLSQFGKEIYFKSSENDIRRMLEGPLFKDCFYPTCQATYQNNGLLLVSILAMQNCSHEKITSQQDR